jgi:hypothetical protein
MGLAQDQAQATDLLLLTFQAGLCFKLCGFVQRRFPDS